MTSTHADLLLGSPLGRDLLAGYVGLGSLTGGLGDRLGLGLPPGTARLTAVQAGRRSRRPAVRAAARFRNLLEHRQRYREQIQRSREWDSGWRQVPADRVRDAVRAAVAGSPWRAELAAADGFSLLAGLSGSTDNFGFSGQDEALWALTAVAAAELRPVAEEFAAQAEAAGWWAPADLTAQRFTAWDGSPRLANGELDRRIRDDMAAERADNASRGPRPPEKEGVRYGACWWSAPPFAEVSWTTPAAGPLPAVSAAGFFDTGIPCPDCTGADILAVEIDPAARVAEINGPDDWRDLTATYPRDVTGTHDGEWRYWGGVPGPWRLPDWERVRDDYDGVHVSPGGYVTSCGLAQPADGACTMLVAWLPGATLWLHDVITGTGLLGRWDGTGPEVMASLDRDLPQWHPAS